MDLRVCARLDRIWEEHVPCAAPSEQMRHNGRTNFIRTNGFLQIISRVHEISSDLERSLTSIRGIRVVNTEALFNPNG